MSDWIAYSTSGRRGDLPPLVRGAGLHQHGTALRIAGDVQRAAHLEVFSAVVEGVHFGFVEEDFLGAVVDECVVFPTVPQPGDDLDEFLGALIAGVVVEMFLAVEVLCFRFGP
jgi:hypothetical protein